MRQSMLSTRPETSVPRLRSSNIIPQINDKQNDKKKMKRKQTTRPYMSTCINLFRDTLKFAACSKYILHVYMTFSRRVRVSKPILVLCVFVPG